MTVSELIEELRKYSQDAPVYVLDHAMYRLRPLTVRCDEKVKGHLKQVEPVIIMQESYDDHK